MPKKNRFKRLFCLLGFSGVTILALPQVVYPTRVEFPLIQSLGYFPYSDNSLLKKGEYSGAVEVDYSNVYMFNSQHTILNDFEVFSTTIGVRYGLWKGGTLELYYRHSMIFGGVLDKFIEDFHRAFSLPDNQRGEYPRGSVHYRYRDYFSYTGNQGASSPLILAFLKKIYQSPHLSLSTRAALGLPLSKKPGFSSDKPFLTLGLVTNYKKGKISLGWSNYVNFFKKPTWLGDEDIIPSLFFSSLEAQVFRIILGFNFRTSVFREDKVAHSAYQVYVGYRISRYLEFLFLEDFSPYDTTPDVGFHLRVKVL